MTDTFSGIWSGRKLGPREVQVIARYPNKCHYRHWRWVPLLAYQIRGRDDLKYWATKEDYNG